MIEKQFTLYLENKPGALASVTRMLAVGKVNIEGISAATSSDVGLIQIVTSDTATTRKLLNRAKVPFTVQDVALLPLSNRPGALADIIAYLAKSGVNVNYVYATACGCRSADCRCYAVISAPDLKKVEKAWKATADASRGGK